MVFVACVVVELEELELAVVPVVLLPVVLAADPDVGALSVLWSLDEEELDCAVEDWSVVALGEDDWESKPRDLSGWKTIGAILVHTTALSILPSHDQARDVFM